jgi:HlyD family secretion protein
VRLAEPTYDGGVSSALVRALGHRTVRATVLVVLASGTLSACHGSGTPPIIVDSVGRATVVEVVEAPASAVPNATTTISSPASGTVATLRVRDGQQVAAGRLLMVINSPQAHRALAQARQAQAAASAATVSVNPIDVAAARQRADAAAARAFAVAQQAAQAIADPATRAQALTRIAQAQAQYRAASAQTSLALAQINAGASSVAAAVNSLGAAQQTQATLAVHAAQRAVDSLRVTAPIAGRVAFGSGSDGSSGSSALNSLPGGLSSQAQALLGGSTSSTTSSGSLRPGAPVTAGSTLVTVTDMSAMTLSAQVDETDILLVRPGVSADVQFDAVPGATYDSQVLSVDVNPTTSTRGGVAYPVRLALGAGHFADGRVAPRPLPGMSAVAALRVRTAVDAVAVPASAVFRNGTQDDVWLVTGGLAHQHRVSLGAQGEAVVQVIDGLSVGDQIVTHGADQVHEGQRVP